MSYHFRNLVFEGGGVKGVAYIGAMKVLESKGILPQIERVGGTSAGAINASLFALGYSMTDTKKIIKEMDFNKFMDDSFGVIRDLKRLNKKFGWHKGDFFHNWIGDLIKDKLGSKKATFLDLQNAGKPALYVYGTNLSTRFGEVFSVEHTPDFAMADAVRISMSIPLFFKAYEKERKNSTNDFYVDGGVLNNFPIKLFDRKKYITKGQIGKMAVNTKYYKNENDKFLKKHPKSSPYIYNRETLGLRLDSKQEIAVFRYGQEPIHHEIDCFFNYAKALMATIIESQGNAHLHGDDWHRTIYIDTLGVGTTDFNLSSRMKKKLEDSGTTGADKYFKWYHQKKNKPLNRPK